MGDLANIGFVFCIFTGPLWGPNSRRIGQVAGERHPASDAALCAYVKVQEADAAGGADGAAAPEAIEVLVRSGHGTVLVRRARGYG